MELLPPISISLVRSGSVKEVVEMSEIMLPVGSWYLGGSSKQTRGFVSNPKTFKF